MALQGLVQSGRKTLLQIAKFRHKVQIVKPVLGQDSTGGWNVRNNAVVITTWGTIEALSGVEKFAAHEFSSQVTHKVWIRHPRTRVDKTGNTSGIDASMQVWFGTRQFQVEVVLNPDERKDVLLLMCVEIDDSKNQAGIAPPESAL